jgi:translation initiation factor eIF-2B subunit epsilon
LENLQKTWIIGARMIHQFDDQESDESDDDDDNDDEDRDESSEGEDSNVD